MEKVFIGNEDIDLRAALIESAQCFQWTEEEGGFCARIAGKNVCVWNGSDGIWGAGTDAAFLRRYLDLDTDYASALSEYMWHPQCREAVQTFHGIRVLRQDPWETLLSFILSANNNVNRIRKLTFALMSTYGEKVVFCGREVCGFPQPEALLAAGEDGLRRLGTGYRAPYLMGTARMIADGFPLYALEEMPYEDAHAALLKLPGVGDKVADCVLLFGCGHREAFPVDVWVERLMGAWFGMEEKNRWALGEKSRRLLGKNAGLLQQFLFHAARTGAISI